MSEGKRVTLTTISNTVSSSLMTTGTSSAATLRFGADFLAPPDKPTPSTTVAGGGKGAIKTLRLKVELFQTDSNKYPEFDYAKLLHLEKKKIKKLSKKTNGFSDPFEENDDDVARIAKELERKYGSAYSSGRGKNKRDDVDIGLGYDESDSFIDNTEAYDELIPDEVETIEGGFYINCGALEFKKLHPESMTTKTDEIIKMPNRPKKRVISSSSEDSSSSDDDDDDDEEDDDDDDDDDSDDDDGDGEDGKGEETSVETNKSKSSFATTSLGSKKAKVSRIKTNPENSNKKKSNENGNAAKKKKIKTSSGLLAGGSSSNSPKPTTDDLATDSERERSVKKITSVKDMLKAQRDNYLKSRSNDAKSSNGDNNSKEKSSGDDDDDESSSSDDSDDDDDDDDDDDGNSAGNSDSNQGESKERRDKKTSSTEENFSNLRTADIKLPYMELEDYIFMKEFREGIKRRNMMGKNFKFDDNLAENFLKIDDVLLCMDKSERNTVFAHLEYHLSLPKYYFLRKAKQLRIKQEKLKSKRAFNKLHKAVTETMPAVIASYDAELRRYNEFQPSNANSEQPPKMPKKKFPWNTNFRNLLYDVYQVRWTSFPVLGTRKESLEEFLTLYMSKKVVDIWPNGWMSYEELQKEIEKRKTAAKKAKEKGKPITQIAPNQPAAVNSASHQDLSAARSNENSETDSIASSNTSSGLKRKNIEASGSKQSKSKAAKINGEKKKPSSSLSSTHMKTAASNVDMVTSPSKKSDHSINHIISPTSVATSTSTSALPSPSASASSIFSSNVSALSQPLKHSTKTHVIDLDYYTNASDILQTTKQIQQAAAAAAAAAATTNSTTFNSQFAITNVNSLQSNKSSVRRESSGDSEIEIVGVFPAKAPKKKQKTNSRSATPNSNPNVGPDKAHNNNNYNNNKNSKKSASVASTSGGPINIMGMDVANNIIDLRGEDVKPIHNTATNSSLSQQTSTLVPTSSSTLPSTHQ